MENDERLVAQEEINKTLFLCNFFLGKVGLSFLDEPPVTHWGKFKNMLHLGVSVMGVLLLVCGDIAYICSLLVSSTSVAEIIASLHLLGYAFIRYTIVNQGGVMLYFLTPIVLHFYRKVRGEDSDLGYVWHVAYPFDKYKPYYHEAVFLFEIVSGQSAVWFMLSSDLLFSAMTSHISMLLRLLQLKIRCLAMDTNKKRRNQRRLTVDTSLEGHTPLVIGIGVKGLDMNYVNCVDDIIACVKIHQRLINYFNDLEDAFSLVNLINVLLSSVNICCVVFVIVLLEPWMEVSNKFFLCAAVTQMGILCWYADDICTASVEVADAVYESGWYKSNTRCRRYLLSILQRSQKPLYYTAMKFNNITMTTYASILTTAYSYFALLYTMYSQN